MPHFTSVYLLNRPSISVAVPIIQKLQPRVVKALVLAGDGVYLASLADTLKTALDYDPDYLLGIWWDDRNAGNPSGFSTLRNTATRHEAGSQHYDVSIAYDAWRAACRVDLEACAGRDNFWVESFIEIGIEPTYLAFERQRVTMTMSDYGLRSSVVNMAVGWSTLGHFEMMREVGLIQTLRDNDGAYGEHGYMSSALGAKLWHGPDLPEGQKDNQAAFPDGRLNKTPLEISTDTTVWPDTVPSWLGFRSSMSHQWLTMTGGGDVMQFMSEYGKDDAGFQSYRHHTNGQGVGAWSEAIPHWRAMGLVGDHKSPEQFYGEQLALGERQMEIYEPWLKGATVFCVGSDPHTRWALYDVLDTPVFDHFLAALAELPPGEVDPPEPPEPPALPPLPDDGKCWVQALHDRVNIRAAPNTNAEQIGLLQPGQIEATAGFVLQENDPARAWFKLDTGGYVAEWVTRHTLQCHLLDPEPEPPPGILQLLLVLIRAILGLFGIRAQTLSPTLPRPKG